MSQEGPFGIVEPKFFTFAEPPNELELEGGRKLGPITLAYETYGTLNADQSNAVLIVHALSGDAHAAGFHAESDARPGWWDNMIGPGKGFDTNKYFVICSNVLGGCRGSTGPGSIDPATGKPYGLDFPVITIGDIVHAQRFLVEYLGITKLLCVAGGSMGGMQTLEWITRYPEMTASSIVIASTPVLSPMGIAFDSVGRHAIQADPAFNDGAYYGGEEQPDEGLAIARMLAHITYLSDQSMGKKFGRALRFTREYSYDFKSEFSVETYLDYQGEQFVNRFDANSYLYITKAINYFDLGAKYGSLDSALARVRGKTMVLSYSSDWLYPPYQSQQVVDALTRQKKDVTYCNIQSDYGHDAFLLEVDVMKKLIGGFLEYAMTPARKGERRRQSIDRETDLDPPTASPSIYEGDRVDYQMIVDMVGEGSRVLDIGCGDGELLDRLIHFKGIDDAGIEVSQSNIVSCVRRGISVIQHDIDKGLTTLPDQSFDVVILSMTLQVIKKPDFVLQEMLRVGKKCIVSFPNFGFWKVRAKSLVLGRAPVTRNLPYAWWLSPNRHVLSIKDFREYCRERGFHIEREFPLNRRGLVWSAQMWPNMLADEAVFVITPHGDSGKRHGP